MITREEADRLRDQLLEVLAEDAHNTERLLSRLDSITQETGIGAHAALLMILTRLAFDESEARTHWEAILRHRHSLSLGLGRDVGIRVAVVDYFINVNRRLVQPTLIELEMFDASEETALRDPLTGLANERSFRHSVQTELRRAKRYRQRVSVALFDLDDFGEANRSLGDLVGDRLLRETAIMLSNKVRDIDVAARPGEDELAVILPETGRNGAVLVAERFRREVEAYFARREAASEPVALTISGGVACYPDDATTPEELLGRAAQALYRAKAGGKNAVQPFTPERRRYLRFDLEPGRFEVEVLEPDEARGGAPANLSRNGIVFSSPEALDVGEEIEIRVVDAGPVRAASPLRMRGRVTRLEELPAEPADGESVAEESDERFEVGVAFDLDWTGSEGDLLEFLEKSQGGGVYSES